MSVLVQLDSAKRCGPKEQSLSPIEVSEGDTLDLHMEGCESCGGVARENVLTKLSKDKDAKTYVDAKGLVIFSKTNTLASYLQGHEVDVMAAKVTCDATMRTLSKGRDKDMFCLIWERALKTARNIIELVSDTEEVETSKQQKNPSKRLQALSGKDS
ncbi:hypothetical protein E2C01_018909 [Portunus trituberculatus]|uniref:Uncharacterized protein n=1 Tax=Portunus trituberculatus TaxID=210409 RepID=A0A5B7DXS2_PORTR|nr:hypothetical protein [Portunus trituberculatus]